MRRERRRRKTANVAGLQGCQANLAGKLAPKAAILWLFRLSGNLGAKRGSSPTSSTLPRSRLPSSLGAQDCRMRQRCWPQDRHVAACTAPRAQHCQQDVARSGIWSKNQCADDDDDDVKHGPKMCCRCSVKDTEVMAVVGVGRTVVLAQCRSSASHRCY